MHQTQLQTLRGFFQSGPPSTPLFNHIMDWIVQLQTPLSLKASTYLTHTIKRWPNSVQRPLTNTLYEIMEDFGDIFPDIFNTIENCTEIGSELLPYPHAKHITHLWFQADWTPIIPLFTSTYVYKLTSLFLDDLFVPNSFYPSLASSPALQTLTHLRVYTVINPDTRQPIISPLLSSPVLSNLQHLDLCEADLSNNDLHTLTQTPYIHTLHTLRICNDNVDDDGLIPLLQSPKLQRLQHLSIRHTNRTPRTLQALIDAPFFQNLQTLDLTIKTDDIPLLNQHPTLNTLISTHQIHT